ncbi:hypothetical protein M3I54_43180 [Paraburkholderia sp. CNPSo 3274]|uniref:hypothetical protein n=1 Tax=unclassified Paraburkholderia TaxID=2615204 RepID=UPI0020B7AF17|nr:MULTISPECIES: hypothetical protein [unclassified Paraburkholderia]MCP3713559.1 hypothetical protein [Paraburkholderia sp. CNPSo 3274]MCP3720545.1 hypothetical protein [Paraburkholderia sp. CNPSo 3281]
MDIIAALSGLKSAIDLAKSAIAARDDAMLAQARSEMLEHVIDVQSECFELQPTNQRLLAEAQAAGTRENALKAELQQIQNHTADITNNYEFRVGGTGSSYYEAKTPDPASNARAYLCANCAASGKKTFLHRAVLGSHYVCSAGHGNIQL